MKYLNISDEDIREEVKSIESTLDRQKLRNQTDMSVEGRSTDLKHSTFLLGRKSKFMEGHSL